MKKLLSLAMALLMVFSLIPIAFSASALAEDAVCVIGTTEYSTLFGEGGALENAAENDTIVLVKDIKETGGVTVSKAVTIDLAGHNIINYSTANVFTNTADVTIRSTVDGLGETYTENQPKFGYSGNLFAASSGVDVSNVSFYEANNFPEYDESSNMLSGVEWVFARYRSDRNDEGVNYSTYDNYTRIATETLIPVEPGKSYYFTYNNTSNTDKFAMDVYTFQRTDNGDGTYTDKRLGRLGAFTNAMGTIPSTSTATHIGISLYCSNNEWSYNSARTKLLPLINNGITPIVYEVTNSCASVASKNTFITLKSDNVKLKLDNVTIDQTVGTSGFMTLNKGCELDVNNSAIKFGSNNNKAAMTINSSLIKGSFKNTTISMNQGFPVVIQNTAEEGVEFNNCEIVQYGSDQWYTFSITGGKATLNGGTVVSCNKAGNCAVSASGGTLVVDDATIKWDKGSDANRTTFSLGNANVTIKKAHIIKGGTNSNLVNSNEKLLAALAEGSALFSSSDYSEDTVYVRAKNFQGMSEVYIGPCGHYQTSATCVEAGTCNYCLSDVPAMGHDATEIQYNDDQHWYKCTRCEYTEGVEAHAVGENGTEATCTTKPVCGVCKQEFDSPLGHSFTNYQPVSTEEAGCEHNPVTKAICDRGNCDAVDYDYSALTNLVTTKEPKAPTCTEKGWTIEESCKICNKVINPSTDIEPLGHTWGEVVVTEGKEPTYLLTGEGTRTCEVCNDVDTVILPKKEFDKDTVAISGGYVNPVQYTSLFEADGAVVNAQAGDTIILIKDTTEYSTVTIDKDITIDLAGHTLTSESTTGGIITTGNITVRSTVDGLGEINTEEKASVSYATAFVKGSNANVFSNLAITAVSNGSFFVATEDTAKLTVKDSTIGVGSGVITCLTFTGKAVKVDFENVDIASGTNNNKAGITISAEISGTFKNCNISMKQGFPVQITKTAAEGLIFTGCSVSQSASDQGAVFQISGGNVTLNGGTVINGGYAHSGLSISGGNVVLDDVHLNGAKPDASTRVPIKISGGNVQIKKAKITKSKTTANLISPDQMDKFVEALADGYCVYSKEMNGVPNCEYACFIDTDFNTLSAIYVDVCEHESEATCTEGGSCVYCGKYFEALGHSFEQGKYRYAGDDENHWKICTRCGIKDETSVEAHTLGENATCGKQDTCAVCKLGYGAVLEHDWDENGYVNDNNATCEGNCTETTTCKREGCNATHSREIEGTALGHKCDDLQGNKTHHWYACSREGCDYIEGEEEHYGGTATCTSEATCALCRKSYGEALGHDWDEEGYVDDNNATCTENATKTTHCKREGCTETKSVEVPKTALGHIIVEDPAIPPSCEDSGYTAGSHCERCKETIENQKVIPAFGYHTWDDGVMTSGTCSKKGKIVYTCTYCGEKKTVETSLNSSVHTLAKKPTVKATYFSAGKYGDTYCTSCGRIISVGKTIPKKILKAPKLSVKAGSQKLTVKYKKVTGATGFRIQYRIAGSKKWTTKTVWTTKSKNKVISKLKSGVKYNIRICAAAKNGKTKVYSKWSKVGTYTVK